MPDEQIANKPIDTDKFLGLAGIWKQWANLGVVGVVCGIVIYLITVAVPKAQQSFHDELRLEREAARTEQQKSREHGEMAIKEISTAIRYQTTVLDDNQRAVRKNQEKLIELQEKLLQKK